MVPTDRPQATSGLQGPSQAERERIVRLCSLLTGRADVAEDLAQETFLEAWRHSERLRDPQAYSSWLSGIARNVCRRWARNQWCVAQRWSTQASDVHLVMDEIDWPDEGFDLEVELERAELAVLLDRALAALPPVTRDVLIARFIEERAHADIAEQFGLSECAVAVRIHRGKAMLRTVLATAFRDEAMVYGLVHSIPLWQQTRIWCMTCGRRRLDGQFDPARGDLVLRCPACCHDTGAIVTQISEGNHFWGIKGYRAAVDRVQRWADEYYRLALYRGETPCIRCGRPMPVRLGALGNAPPVLHGRRGVAVICEHCAVGNQILLASLALSRPEGRAFWRQHPRMRALPERPIDVDGHAAVVVGFEAFAGADRFEVVYALEDYRVMQVHGGCGR